MLVYTSINASCWVWKWPVRVECRVGISLEWIQLAKDFPLFFCSLLCVCVCCFSHSLPTPPTSSTGGMANSQRIIPTRTARRRGEKKKNERRRGGGRWWRSRRNGFSSREPFNMQTRATYHIREKRTGLNSGGLVNRTTIVKHLPYILAISFFFPLASFWVCSTPN